MSLRDFLDAAFTMVVDELRRQGASLYDAFYGAKDAFQDPTPEERVERQRIEEAEKARQTQQALAAFGQYALPPARKQKKPPPDLPEGAPA